MRVKQAILEHNGINATEHAVSYATCDVLCNSVRQNITTAAEKKYHY